MQVLLFCYCPQVDSQDLKHSTHLQAMQTLWNSGPVIKLFIQRKVSVASEGNLSFSESVFSVVSVWVGGWVGGASPHNTRILILHYRVL